MRTTVKNLSIIVSASFLLVCSCEKPGSDNNSDNVTASNGFFIVNEGNYLSGNGSLSFYSYDSSKVYNNIFESVNGRPLGDVANSATVAAGKLYIVVNNSGKIEVANLQSMVSAGTLSGINSPRFVEVIDRTKAYVSSLYSDSVVVFNPETLTVTGYINLSMSSEQITLSGSRAFVTNWSGEKSLTIIDTDKNEVIDIIDLAPEPGRVVFDIYGNGWILCSGGYLNQDYPALYKINPLTGVILKMFEFDNLTDSPVELCIDNTGRYLYYINGDIFRMDIDDTLLPEQPLVESGGRVFYRMGFDSKNSHLLVTDAVDYMQRGYVYGFSPEGDELFSFMAGIIPGTFCFKEPGS